MSKAKDATPSASKVWVSAQVTEKVKREFRILCATEDKSMSEKIEELINEYVSEELD